MQISRPIEILLVEDNPGDIMLTKQAFKKSKVANNIQVMEDGEAAWTYLQKIANCEITQTPDIILLDINLPKRDGRQLLTDIKSHSVLRTIPVIILSSSKSEQDIIKTYAAHANGYVIKPVNLAKLIDIVNAIEHFWFSVVVLPNTTSDL